MGRPPKPLKRHRRVGRGNGTRKANGAPLPAVVTPLPMAPGVPETPGDLEAAGRILWHRAWATGITWVSPLADLTTIEETCRLVDDLALARNRYRATTEPADARAVAALHKLLAESLSALGFDPTARARLGVAEVKRVSVLDELLERRGHSSALDGG